MNWVSKNWRGLLVLVLGLAVVGATHYVLHSCADVGHFMKTSSGMNAPMKCSWTEAAVQGMGGMVAVIGLMMLILPTLAQGLSLAAGFTGVLMIATTLWLIGTCPDPMMTCNMSLKPGALLLGALIAIAGFIGTIKVRTYEGRGAVA